MGLEMRLAFLTPARVNIIYISTDRCQKPLALILQWFQGFIFDTPIYSMSTHNYTICSLSILPHLYCSNCFIHISHNVWSFGFDAPHIIHTPLLCTSYLQTMSVIVNGIWDKSESASYQLSPYHFAFASMTSYFETKSYLTSSFLISLHISNIKSRQPMGSVSNNVSCSLPISSHGYSSISSRFLVRSI